MLPMTTSDEGMVTAQRIQTELRKEVFLPDLSKVGLYNSEHWCGAVQAEGSDKSVH